MLYVNFSVKCLKFAPKWPIFYFQPTLADIFVTIATIKVESIPEFYTLAKALINYLKETIEKQLLFFCLIGDQNSLFMHIPLCLCIYTSICEPSFAQQCDKYQNLMWRLIYSLSRYMRFPTMWYVRPAKAQTSLRIRAV